MNSWNRHRWRKFEEEWEHTGHHENIDADSVTIEELKSLMTWDTPIENFPPEVVGMILSLLHRIERLEEKLEECSNDA